MRPFSSPRNTSRAGAGSGRGGDAGAIGVAAGTTTGPTDGRPRVPGGRVSSVTWKRAVSERPGGGPSSAIRDGLTGRSVFTTAIDISSRSTAFGAGPGGFVSGGASGAPFRRGGAMVPGGAVAVSGRAAGAQPHLQALDHQVGPGLPVLVDRVLVAVEALVDRPEVEVDLRVALRELERLQERGLGVLQAAQLEADEAQVVVQGVGLGALRDELAVDLLRLVELLSPEVDEAEEVQHARVPGPEEVGLLELPLGLFEPAGLEVLPPLVVVSEEQALVEGASGDGVGHASRGREPSSRPSPPGAAPRPRGCSPSRRAIGSRCGDARAPPCGGACRPEPTGPRGAASPTGT